MIHGFMIEYRYDPNQAEQREALRESHLAYRANLGDRLLLAGPYLADEDSQRPPQDVVPVGTMMIVKAQSLAHARELALGDPFVAAGVIHVESVRPMIAAKGSLLTPSQPPKLKPLQSPG